MRIDGIETTTIADGVAVEGGYDLALFHKPGSDVVTGLIGDGVEFTGRFRLGRDAARRMATALGVVTTGEAATPASVDALAQVLAKASGVSSWDKVSESDGGDLDFDGRGYWRRLASAALGTPFAPGAWQE